MKVECQSEIKDYEGNRRKKQKQEEDHRSQVAATPVAGFPGATTHCEEQ